MYRFDGDDAAVVFTTIVSSVLLSNNCDNIVNLITDFFKSSNATVYSFALHNYYGYMGGGAASRRDTCRSNLIALKRCNMGHIKLYKIES